MFFCSEFKVTFVKLGYPKDISRREKNYPSKMILNSCTINYAVSIPTLIQNYRVNNYIMPLIWNIFCSEFKVTFVKLGYPKNISRR